jgi:hypothetical protein
MRFEHLIQINDPLMPLLDPITRAQLWRGLVRRAEEPTLFVLGLESAVIHGRTDAGDQIERTLDFGNFQVRDRVVLRSMESSQTRVDACERFPSSRLTIAIEEPQPELLFLRFVYEFDDPESAGEIHAPAGDADATTEGLRREAYRTADLDTVARIRDLALAGELG